MEKDYYKLNNGIIVPKIGYGTYKSPNDEQTVDSIKYALEVGYRHLDTAAFYGNEQAVGKAVRESGLKRGDIFVTTKLWNTVRGYKETLDAFDKSLNELGLEYVDMYMIHWPVPFNFRGSWLEADLESYAAMEEMHKKGRVRCLAVSNFLKKHLEPFLSKVEIKPVVNQMEVNPVFYDRETIDYCKQNDILVECWSPLARARHFDLPIFEELAAKYNVTPARICLNWEIKKGLKPLPKSLHRERIKENFDVFGFELSPEDIDKLDKVLDLKLGRVGSDPDNCPY